MPDEVITAAAGLVASFLSGLLGIGGGLAACTAPPAPVGTPPRAASPTSTGPATASAPVAWRRLADIPTPRSEVAAAVYQQDKVYVIGGFGGPDRVERYDAVTGRWDRIADLPQGVDHAMSAAVFGIQTGGDEGVYVFGGYDGCDTARRCRLRGVGRPHLPHRRRAAVGHLQRGRDL